MILECQCGQKVQVPDAPSPGAVYVCNRCYRTLPVSTGGASLPAPAKKGGKAWRWLGGGAVAMAVAGLAAVLYYNTPPAEVGTRSSVYVPPAASAPAVPSQAATPDNSDENAAPSGIPTSAASQDTESPAKAREDEIVAQDAGRLGDPELENDYQDVNNRYFDNQLPNLPVLWEPRLDEVGPLIARGYVMQGLASSRPELILINPRTRDDPAKLRRVLCHEMIHIYLYTQHDLTAHHGPAFQEQWRRLLRAGAFQGVDASQSEKERLQARLRSESSELSAESSRLAGTNSQLDQEGSEIDQEKSALEQVHADLNQRIVRANREREGWPSLPEMDAYRQRARALNQRIAAFRARVAAFNAQVAGFNAACQRFNREVARYRMMMDNPDGLEGHTIIPDQSELTPHD